MGINLAPLVPCVVPPQPRVVPTIPSAEPAYCIDCPHHPLSLHLPRPSATLTPPARRPGVWPPGMGLLRPQTAEPPTGRSAAHGSRGRAGTVVQEGQVPPTPVPFLPSSPPMAAPVGHGRPESTPQDPSCEMWRMAARREGHSEGEGPIGMPRPMQPNTKGDTET